VDVQPGLRREAPFDPANLRDEPDLVERIAAEIELNGPMTFARFMELALYDPEHGYYMSSRDPTGRGGDFLTAPETHPIFGATMARVVYDAWERLGQPVPFVVREYGPGTGTLAVTTLRALAATGPRLAEAIRYDPVEVATQRLTKLRSRIVEAGFEKVLEPPPPGPFDGFVLANEYLDALPVHRLVGGRDGLLELFVDREDDRFVERPGPPSTPALAARLAAERVALEAGQRAEICLAVEPWLTGVSSALHSGLILVIDYMLPAAELYGPARPDGTLRAYVNQRVHGDPFRHVGRQDLTAHVDQTALETAAWVSGLDVLGVRSQAEFLVGAGLGELAESIRRAPGFTLEGALELRAALGRLLDPRATGGFRVAVLGRGLPVEPPLTALGFRMPERQ
jgi:SAM-dependent MidA family methyltransferase